jgi:hypothetical protein
LPVWEQSFVLRTGLWNLSCDPIAGSTPNLFNVKQNIFTPWHETGLPVFLRTTYQKRDKKRTKCLENIPNGYQIVIKYQIAHKIVHNPQSCIPSPSEKCQMYSFGNEKIPFDNPGIQLHVRVIKLETKLGGLLNYFYKLKALL